MGVDEAERRLLPREMDEDARQDRVLENIGEIAGVKGVAIVHRLGPSAPAQRIGATAIDAAWQVWPETLGQLAKAPRSLQTQKRTSTSSPLRQVDRHVSARRLGLAARKACADVVRRERQALVRRLQRRGDDDPSRNVFTAAK